MSAPYWQDALEENRLLVLGALNRDRGPFDDNGIPHHDQDGNEWYPCPWGCGTDPALVLAPQGGLLSQGGFAETVCCGRRDAEIIEWAHATNGRRPFTKASAITKKRVRWLWRGRLATGYLAVWCGAGDIGKSLFSAWVIRCLTLGELEGEFFGDPRNALIVCTEDGREDMWLPRLEAVGADRDRVAFLDYPYGWNLRDGVGWIDDAIQDGDFPLVFVDALMAHMPEARGRENTHSPTFVRAALDPLAGVCKRRAATALFGLHPRKAGGDTFADVVQESGAFTQLPRLGLLFGYHPDDIDLPRHQQRRVLLRGKGNLGRDPGALSFRIAEKFLDFGSDDDPDGIADGVAHITDMEPCSVTERQLLAVRPKQEKRVSKEERATQLIRMALRDGAWHDAEPIRELLAEYGLNHNETVSKATFDLKVQKEKQERVRHGQWRWRIGNSVELGADL